jgi:VWFA-related protein
MQFTIAAVALLALPLLRASDSGQPEPRLLDLNVIAFDNHGQQVTDLTADDFQITDAGKPEKISFFRVNQPNSREPASPLGPHEFSNRVPGESRGATVILFDLLNLGFGARGMATNQIEHDLPQITEGANSIYMYVLSVDGGLFPVRDIRPPADPADPDAGPAPSPEPASAPWTRQTKPMLDTVLRAVTRVRSVDIDVFVRILLTFRALETLGSRVAAIPGRKNIVWVTDGVPFFLGEMRSDTGEPIDFTPEIRKLCEALDSAYVSLYPVRQIMMG